MVKKILFPVDLSQDMDKITPLVREMADKFDAEIHCVYSLHVTSYYTHIGMAPAYIADFEINAKQSATDKLEKFALNNFQGNNVKTRILIGRPGDQIVEYAESNQIDLIIMGHSTTGIERAIIGSVAGHVVKYAPAPVLIVSPEVLKK